LKKRIVPLLISTAVALGVGEVICRVALDEGQSTRFQQDVQELEGLGLERLAAVIVDDDELFWRFAPGSSLERTRDPFFSIISNEQGLREDHVIPTNKLAGEKRVLFLGDSCTFGFGLDFDEGFVEKSEDLLAAEFPNADIECINAGVPGYSIFQGWRYLETEGLAFEPDVIVACFGWNDMSSWDSQSDLAHYEASQAALPPEFLRSSQLAKQVWRVLAKRPADVNEAEKRPRVPPREFRELLGKLHAASAANGAELVLIVWGFLYQVEDRPDERTQWQRELYAFAQERDVPLLDLVPEFQKLARAWGAPGVFFDYGHATAEANTVIAQLVAARLAALLR